VAQSGPDIRHWRCLLMGAKRTCPRIPRTHRADPKLGIHNHSTAQKRLTTSLISLCLICFVVCVRGFSARGLSSAGSLYLIFKEATTKFRPSAFYGRLRFQSGL